MYPASNPNFAIPIIVFEAEPPHVFVSLYINVSPSVGAK